MATDATGTPTSPDGIPTYNVDVDAPSGLGFNAAMAAIQAALSTRISTPAGILTGEVPVWNGTTWARSSVQKFVASGISGYPSDATKTLHGDGSWSVPLLTATAKLSATGATGLVTSTQSAIQLLQAYDWNTDTATFGARGGVASGFTVVAAGYYLLQAQLVYPANATGSRWTAIWRNGAQITSVNGNGTIEDVRLAASGVATEVVLSGVLSLSANDLVQLVGWQSSGVTLTPTIAWVSLTRMA